jgi:hypothetical protein
MIFPVDLKAIAESRANMKARYDQRVVLLDIFKVTDVCSFFTKNRPTIGCYYIARGKSLSDVKTGLNKEFSVKAIRVIESKENSVLVCIAEKVFLYDFQELDSAVKVTISMFDSYPVCVVN